MKNFIILSLLTLFAFGTKANISGDGEAPVNSCFGAMNIFENGEFALQFTGKKSDEITGRYSALKDFSRNQLWCSFIATSAGDLSFDATIPEGFVQMVVFKQGTGEVCEEILTGAADIERLHSNREEKLVGLNENIGNGVLYKLALNKGDKINILFATEEEYNGKLALNWNFKPSIVEKFETKIVDNREDDFAPTFSIKVRDKVTQKPLIANLSIEGIHSLEALYIGSDFFFNVERNCKLVIKCDVEGYFFDDRLEAVTAYEDQEVIIELETITTGKSLAIEEIEFTPGSSEFTKSSIPKLQRLRDFLALNSNMKIEIQGHVFALGKNSFAGQSISEARAKRVLKYLVDNGIDKNRLTAKGYGNTRPIFEKPQFSYEEQANRRVEILIL